MAGGTFGNGHVDTGTTLRQVIETINALEPAPAFAIVGGDLTSPDLLDRHRTLASDEWMPSYRLLREIVGGLRCPARFLLGNHDDRPAFHRVMGDRTTNLDAPHHWSFDHGGCHFVGLDSLVPGKPWGEISTPQLEWLDADLRKHGGRATLVFVHHHPWPLGLAWMDAMSLRNGEQLIGILERHPSVRWIVCGHVHQDYEVQRGQLTMLTTPSTCFQVSKVSQTYKVLAGPPGFRVVRVSGPSLATRVLHLHGADGAAGL
jgi:3',5'-cyclic-AMP phosphodiesterase